MTQSRTLIAPLAAASLESVRPGSPIFLAWIDAHHVADEWLEISEIENDVCQVHSIGFYVRSTNDQVIYASDWTDKGHDEIHVNSVSAIPFGCIREITVMESE